MATADEREELRQLVDSLTDDQVREAISEVSYFMRNYPELDLDVADASIVALAERLRLDTVATIDRRDFTVVRPAHLPAFTLLPDPTG